MNRKERRAAKRGKDTLASSFGPEVDRLFASALQHHQAGQLNEAMLYYQWAIDRRPDFVGARNNFGVALLACGRFEDAAAQFHKAIALKPDFIEFYNNLGRAFFAQGKLDEALDVLGRALKRGGTPDTKSMFVASAKALIVLPDSDDFRGFVLKALSEQWARPSELAVIASNLLKQDKSLKPYIDRASHVWPGGLSDHQLLDSTDIAAISNHRLLCCLLRSTPVVGIELERFLTVARGTVLSLALTSSPVDENQLSFCCALAYQCFLNEYVFFSTRDELERAANLRNLLSAKIESGAPVPDIWIAAAASYSPLDSLPNVGGLLERQWPKEVMGLLIQQVREPDEERQLRAAIPALTPVEDDVSLKVRQHYEENPYPRWVKTEAVHRVAGFDQQMRVKFPLSNYRELGKTGAIDILSAGCGTGRHVIEVAQSMPHARILAVDLSLSSLAYAKRKARESGLGNVEFAQADILRLGSTGRSFDIIEAGGVLHHLGNPFAGWLALLSLLQPRGCMRVGLYSELARQDIVAAQTFVVERGYGQTADDIRRCRQEILNIEQGTVRKNVAGTADFYTISECRDLLFHVQEHRLRLPEIARFINENHLEFLGFEIGPVVLRQYQARCPHDREMTNLDCWQDFETENPDSFISMYQFWIQKKDEPAS